MDKVSDKSARLSCPHCHEPMKLVRTIRPLGPAWSALLVFYCAACAHAETIEEERAAA